MVASAETATSEVRRRRFIKEIISAGGAGGAGRAARADGT
jgi:hypothetical protein